MYSFYFNTHQAALLHEYSKELAGLGGPQAKSVDSQAVTAACELKKILSEKQTQVLQDFSDSRLTVILFDKLEPLLDLPVPEQLPTLSSLEADTSILYLASRSHILLKLVDHTPFSLKEGYDGKLVRLVADFKGVGTQSNQMLGPHNDNTPTYLSKPIKGQSPAPSALALTAVWNPLNEPTILIPISPVLENLDIDHLIALTLPWFCFKQYQVFNSYPQAENIPIVQFDEKVGVCINFTKIVFW